MSRGSLEGRGTWRSSDPWGFGSAAVAAGPAAACGGMLIIAAADCSIRRLLIKERTFVIRLGLVRAAIRDIRIWPITITTVQ